MMSVIVKRVPDNKAFIFTKGADEKLVPLASPSQNQAEIQSLKQNVDAYARQGYRTLAFAMREINPSLIKAEDYKVSPQADAWNMNENHLETEEENKNNVIKPKQTSETVATSRS